MVIFTWTIILISISRDNIWWKFLVKVLPKQILEIGIDRIIHFQIFKIHKENLDHEEYCCSVHICDIWFYIFLSNQIIDALLFSCNQTNKQRVLQKFMDHGFEKVDRTVELFLKYRFFSHTNRFIQQFIVKN